MHSTNIIKNPKQGHRTRTQKQGVKLSDMNKNDTGKIITGKKQTTTGKHLRKPVTN